MPRTLIVPGVSVATQFEVAPPLPARSGILGAVGVVDDATVGVGGVTARQELFDLYGPATQFSFPEVTSALANGVSEVIVSPVRGGARAQATLLDPEGQGVVLLMARAAGPWGNGIRINVTRRLAPDARTVRTVSIEVSVDGRIVETHEGLILSAGHDQDLFTVVNRDSRVIVAVDPEFGLELPALDAGRVAFQDAGAAAATGSLRRGGAALVDLTTDLPGTAGNTISVSVEDGRVTAVLLDATNAPAARIRAAAPAAAGDAALAVSVTANAAAGIDLQVLTNGAPTLSRTGITDVAGLEEALGSSGLLVDQTGDVLPAPTGGPVTLGPTRTVVVLVEGVDTERYEDLPTADAVVAALSSDPNVNASLTAGADGNQRPDVTAAGADAYLTGGRDPGPARAYAGQTNPEAVLELVPAPETNAATTRFRVMAGAAPSTVRIEAGTDEGGGFQLREALDELTMDPDSPNYLPAALAERSGLLRAIDRYPRRGVTSFPAETPGAVPLAGGTMPPQSAFEEAIDALALEDAVDLMLAGLQRWADPNLDGLEVQQAMLGHARAQADAAKPRIVLASVPPALNANVDGIVDHANQVRDRRFVLVAPSGAEGAVAGLLGHLEFFQSPTFKTIASPGVDLVPYRESELNELLGPDGNVSVVASRRGRGVILVRGLTTDGSQISVIRVADRAVREVKAISDRFIGELNNADTRNALQQMIFARFAQLERDGAIVPSVDGSSPAFQVEVYASQVDAAGGIVRIDIAVRPVREIAFVYATITVQL
jgi:hypothetical protein